MLEPNDQRTLFIRARRHPGLLKYPKLECWQTHRGHWLGLKEEGLSNVDEPGEDYAQSLVLGGQNRLENLYNLALALRSTRPGGRVVAAFPNELGAGRYEKLLKPLGTDPFVFSKRKSRVFGVTRPQQLSEQVHQWLAAGAPQVGAHGYHTCPGIYGWDKVDQGSKLLAEQFPSDMAGKVADFGAGYGYLSLQLPPQVRERHLFEVELRAVEAARLNLPQAKVHWCDLLAEPPSQKFDWIVMNPPFHQGKVQSTELGQLLVKQAGDSLKRAGRLLMVANSHLPYEVVLELVFGDCRKVAQKNGFKVLEARR